MKTKFFAIVISLALLLTSCTVYTPGLKHCDERRCYRVVSVTVSEKGVFFRVAR